MDCQSHCGVGQFLNILPNGDVFPCHVLTEPEFLCGNVRERPLREICNRNGLLGALADSDFRKLAMQEGQVESLIQPYSCMGEVYAKTRGLAVWRNNFPLVPLV